MKQAKLFSGPWTGFFNYRAGGERHRTNLTLTFVSGVIYGQGRDTVGGFRITGSYDASTGECHWTKAYAGSHCVAYRGFYDSGAIWGTWAVSAAHHGGFHIWPVAKQIKPPAIRANTLTIPARHTRFQQN